MTLIAQMPEKMRTALNQLFAPRHEYEGAKLPRRIWTFVGNI